MTHTDTLDMAKVATLNFGHDAGAPGGGVNARSSGREDRLDELKASILSMGLLQPLAVAYDEKGRGYVVDGNRRLAALKALVKDGALPKGHEVAVYEMSRDADFREASLAANIVRVPLHPVDQFEAFSGLQQSGLSAEEIASRFGVGLRLVRMRIALGDLAPEVRAAWREDKVSEDAAKAFTLEKSKAKQAEVLAKLIDETRHYRGALNGWQVKSALGYTNEATVGQLESVGREAYVAAGGELVEDLFSDKIIISNPEILGTLGETAVDAKIEELKAEGWGFVIRRPENHWQFQQADVEWTAEQTAEHEALERTIADLDEEEDEAEIEAMQNQLVALEEKFNEAGAPMDEKTRASLGCFVWFGRDGLKVERGFKQPTSGAALKAMASAGATVATPTPAEKGGISKALLHTLSEQRTVAASRALAKNPNMAVMALVAGLETYLSPVRLNNSDAYPVVRPDREHRKFAERLRALQDMPWSGVMDALAAVAAGSLDLRTEKGVDEPSSLALIEALGSPFEAEARKVFNARDYFERASAAVVKDALTEMGIKKLPAKKPDLVELAVTQAEANGWLPAELRLPEIEETE